MSFAGGRFIVTASWHKSSKICMQPPFFCNTYSIYLISSGCFSVISYKLHLAWPWRGLPSPARSVMVLHLPFCVGLHGKCIEGFESLKLYVCSYVPRVIWICKYIYIYLCLYIYDCIRIYVGIMVSKVYNILQNQYVWDSDALLYLSCWFKREDDNNSKTFV